MSNNTEISLKSVGLALGSGSARGWAHIGVIQALSEAGIQVKYVAGASIGSLVGAAFAHQRMAEIEDFARSLDWRQVASLLDVVFPRAGLLDGEKVTALFRNRVQDARIEDLVLRFRAVATDLATGNEVWLDRGDLTEAVRTSISVPGIFTPAKRDGRYLVDGGITNPVPVSVARDMGADFVIAVDLNHGIVSGKGASRCISEDFVSDIGQVDPPLGKKRTRMIRAKLKKLSTPSLSGIYRWLRREPTPNIFEVLFSSISIMETRITAHRLSVDPPDLLLQPKLGHIRFLEFHRADEAIAEGYRQTMVKLKEHGLT